jgi:tetratricopeptide (TPR) repeat protein
MTPSRPDRRGSIAAALIIFAVAYGALEWFAYTQKSATIDEPIHLTTGYAALAERDYRVETTHPPFMRMWAALPLLFMDDVHLDTSVIDRTEPAAWHSGATAFDFSTKFLYVDNDADRLLNAARFMIVLCGILLGILVFSWAYEWLGFTAAVCGLVFYTLSPNIAAHASLVTTDIGITCFIFGTIYFLWRTTRRLSPLNLTGLSIFFALAIVTKFSGLILGPMVLALLIAAVRQRTAITPRTATAIVALLAVVSFVAVWAIHGFRYAPSESPSWQWHLEEAPLARTVPMIAAATGWIDGHRLLPNAFTEGFLIFAQSMLPPNHAYLAGEHSEEGWWYYFVVAFLIKTPIALITLTVIGAVVLVRRRHELELKNEVFVLVPVLLYLVVSSANTFHVGIRHLLPIYPFILLIGAAGAIMLVHGRAGRVALGGMLAFWVWVVADVYPHTLTYFNHFVGGPANGYKYLADSNVDWGQGLKLLKQWMDRQSVPQIGLAYFGTADPAYYDIDYTPLPAATPGLDLPSIAKMWTKPRLPGYVAVGATVLTGVYLDPQWQLFYRGLQQTTPVAVLGNSIFVYRLDRWPEAPDEETPATPIDLDAERRLGDELLRARWFDLAAVHYRRYLDERPSEMQVMRNLGLALFWGGDLDQAIPALRQAVAAESDSGVAQLALASALFDTRRDIREVVAHARRAVALLPADPRARVLLGRALAVSGDLAGAAREVEQALDIDPKDADARQLLQTIQRVARTRHVRT